MIWLTLLRCRAPLYSHLAVALSPSFTTVPRTFDRYRSAVHPGGMREMHWHPNADKWQYYITGTGQMTVFQTGSKAVTADFHPAVFLEIFRAGEYQDISLSDWLTHMPPQMVTAHLNVPADMIAKFPHAGEGVVPI